MTTCRECRDQLSAYREGELDDPLRKALDAHLAGCAECRAQLAELEQMIRQMKGLPPIPVPADFRSRVWQRIEKESGFQRLRRAILEPWYLKLPVEALATAAVVLLVVQVVRVTGPEKMATAPPLQEAYEQEVSKMEEKAAAKEAQNLQEFRKREATLKEAVPADVMDTAAGLAAPAARRSQGVDVSSMRAPLVFRLYAPDPDAARDAVKVFIVEKLKGNFEKTENSNPFLFQISADRLNELRDGLFEFGSFEQVFESGTGEDSVYILIEILPERDSQLW